MNTWILIFMFNAGVLPQTNGNQVVFIEDGFHTQSECMQQGTNISKEYIDVVSRGFLGRVPAPLIKCIPSVKKIDK
jgi:hypothetical protein